MTCVDDEQYRKDVLLLPSEESEVARAQRLADEAHRIGLKIPEIEVAASLTASIASGMVDISSSSPVLSSGSSTCEGSTSTTAACGVAPPSAVPPAAVAGPANSAPPGGDDDDGDGVSPLDQVASSLSELTGVASSSSKPLKSGSVRSMASLSTRPTSYCSNEGKWIYGYGVVNEKSPARLQQQLQQQQQQQQLSPQPATNRNSTMSVASGDKKSKRRASLMSVFGKMPFRRKRAPSSVLLPPEAQITVTKGELGEDKVFVESKQSDAQPDTPAPDAASEAEAGDSNESTAGGSSESSVMRLEIPVFDRESLQRSLVHPDLVKMREAQWLERNRHVAFQEAFMSRLRCRQQALVADRLAENKRLEDEKREQVSLFPWHIP